MKRFPLSARKLAMAGALFIGLLGASGRLAAQDIGQGQRAAELTDRFADRVSQALGFDVDRSERLRAALQRSRQMRQELAVQRQSLFRELAELARRDRVDQERVNQLLDEILRTQVREAEINVDEQGRLSEFMVPLERARLLWMRQRFLQQARRQGQNLQRDNQIRSGDRRPPPAAEQRTVPDPRPPQS
jgi:hypothetical protein